MFAASFQSSVVDVLVEKTIKAAQEKDKWYYSIAGGVAANVHLEKNLWIGQEFRY